MCLPGHVDGSSQYLSGMRGCAEWIIKIKTYSHICTTTSSLASIHTGESFLILLVLATYSNMYTCCTTSPQQNTLTSPKHGTESSVSTASSMPTSRAHQTPHPAFSPPICLLKKFQNEICSVIDHALESTRQCPRSDCRSDRDVSFGR